MVGMFQPDLSLLFPHATIWRTLLAALLAITPYAVVLSAYATWRVGDRRGLKLMTLALIYLCWMLWPFPLGPDAVELGRLVSILGFFWLVAAWSRRIVLHEALLLVANGLVALILLCVVVIASVELVRTWL